MEPEHLVPSQARCAISGQANSNFNFVKIPDCRLELDDRTLDVGLVFIDDYIGHIRGILVGTFSLVNTFRLDLFEANGQGPGFFGLRVGKHQLKFYRTEGRVQSSSRKDRRNNEHYHARQNFSPSFTASFYRV